MKKIKYFLNKTKTISRKTKKYFVKIIGEVVVEERNNIKAKIASTFKNVVQIICTTLTAIALIFAIAVIVNLAKKYNVSTDLLKEAWLALTC